MKALAAVFTLIAAVPLIGADRTLVEGNPNSPVRVIIYEDLQCPDCADFRLMLDQQILPKYAGKAAFEHRDFPLPKHKWARRAAIAARFFQTVKPELAIEWRRYAMGHLREITPENFNERLEAWAKANGADPAKALAALDDQALADAVEADYQDGIARGVAHTPTVLVDSEPFIETFTVQEIAQSLDKATSGK
jgi:protein-disulfide isomerase